MIMGSSRPGPDELDYGYVVMHELFHTYQNAYIALSSENQTQQFYKDLGGKMTGDSDNTVWWSEGVANFLAMSLYAKQPEIEDGFTTPSAKQFFNCFFMTGEYSKKSYENFSL